MRILGGEFRGRTLLAPAGKGTTRPMTSLAKKSLFDTLGARLDGALVVDLYCGTGTLGLEALSRGAARACFAERDAGAVKRLRGNIESLDVAERSVLWRGDVARRLSGWLARLDRPIDAAFVDPPYETVRRWPWPMAEKTIFRPLADALNEEGVVMLRLPGRAEAPLPLAGLAAEKTKEYGDMTVLLLSPEKT